MAFRFQHGKVADVAQLGALAGQAEKAKRQSEQALRFAMQVQAQRNQIRLAEMRMEAQFQSQLRGEAFEIEKINIRNQHDFDFQEQKRLNEMGMQHMQDMKKKAGYDATLEAINTSERLSEDEKERARINLSSKHNMGSSVISATSRPEDQIMNMLNKQMTDQPTEDKTIGMSVLEAQKSATQAGKVLMIDKNTGQHGVVERDEVEGYLSAGTHKLPGQSYDEQVAEQEEEERRFQNRSRMMGMGAGMGFYF